MRTVPLLLLLAMAPVHAAEPTTWITAGDAAWQSIRKAYPKIKPRESRPGMAGAEKVHLIEVNTRELDNIARRLHKDLRHCGGFMYHANEADAHQFLDAPAVAAPRSYAITNQAVVTPVLAQMTEAGIAATIEGLTGFANRYYTSAPGIAASDWLKKKWLEVAGGRDNISVEQYAHTAFAQRSVIATIQGSDRAAEVIVIGAHLDTINLLGTKDTTKAPGADDDASGVAGLTEVLRALAVGSYKPRRTIRLIAYAAEEVGLRGSQEIAREYKKTGVNVVGVMQLDMTNYKGSDKDIYVFTDYTDAAQNVFVADLVKTYLPALSVGYDKCGYACSDHASWSAQGYPTSMPFEAEIKKDNPHIHTSTDTYARSGGQAVHALKFAKLAAAYAVELGSEK